MTLPIIFVHQGNSPYLAYSLFQARSSNPDAQIILLGDRENRGVAKYFRHDAVSEYFQGAAEFEAVYQHMSSNPHDFELFCIQRWFILRDFMRAQAISHCVVADTDVLIYSDLEPLWNHYRQADFAMHESCAHFVFVNSLEGLEKFCRYCLELYTREEYRQRLERRYARFVEVHLPGGNCDMTIFEWYRREHPERVAETGGIHDDATFDVAVIHSGGFEMCDSRKRIVWRDNVPYGHHLELQRQIRFHNLHFQGVNKEFIPENYKGAPIPNGFAIEPTGLRLYRRARRTARDLLPSSVRATISRLRSAAQRSELAAHPSLNVSK